MRIKRLPEIKDYALLNAGRSEWREFYHNLLIPYKKITRSLGLFLGRPHQINLQKHKITLLA